MATTSRGIVYPTTGQQVTPLASNFAALAESANTAIDDLADQVESGANTLIGDTVDRPTAGKKGRTYFATDTNILWYDNGATWKNRTPGIMASLTSATGVTNGSVILSWTNSVTLNFVDTGGFWSVGTPTRITAPYTGVYEVSYTVRHNGVAPVTASVGLNNSTAATAYMWTASQGMSGAATTATRTALINLNANDYLDIRVQSTATASGSHNFVIKYLGEK